MQERDFYRFVVDVRRLRPLVSVIVTVIVIIPSFLEMGTQDLSAVSVLERLAEALAFTSVLVWLASSVIVRYARIQLRKSLEERNSN